MRLKKIILSTLIMIGLMSNIAEAEVKKLILPAGTELEFEFKVENYEKEDEWYRISLNAGFNDLNTSYESCFLNKNFKVLKCGRDRYTYYINKDLSIALGKKELTRKGAKIESIKKEIKDFKKYNYSSFFEKYFTDEELKDIIRKWAKGRVLYIMGISYTTDILNSYDLFEEVKHSLINKIYDLRELSLLPPIGQRIRNYYTKEEVEENIKSIASIVKMSIFENYVDMKERKDLKVKFKLIRPLVMKVEGFIEE